MEIKRLVVGWGQANCYVVYRKGHDEALIIDPGGDGPDILACLQALNLQGAAILCTHGHADHIGALGDLHKQGEVPIYVHANDASYLTTPAKNLSQAFTAYDPITRWTPGGPSGHRGGGNNSGWIIRRSAPHTRPYAGKLLLSDWGEPLYRGYLVCRCGRANRSAWRRFCRFKQFFTEALGFTCPH